MSDHQNRVALFRKLCSLDGVPAKLLGDGLSMSTANRWLTDIFATLETPKVVQRIVRLAVVNGGNDAVRFTLNVARTMKSFTVEEVEAAEALIPTLGAYAPKNGRGGDFSSPKAKTKALKVEPRPPERLRFPKHVLERAPGPEPESKMVARAAKLAALRNLEKTQLAIAELEGAV